LTNAKYLVVQTAFPGDSILTLPFIQELRRLDPEGQIDIVCSPVCQEIFEVSPSVSNVIPFDKRGEYKGFRGLAKFAARLKETGYSAIYSLHRSFRTTILVTLAGGDESIGFNTASFSFLYDKKIPYVFSDHEVKRNLNMIMDYPGDKWKIYPELAVSEEQRQKVMGFIEATGSGKIILISPGSVWETKRYPSKSYAEIASGLSAAGYKIIISGSSSEKDTGEEIRRIAGDQIINSCGIFSMAETVELMSHSELVITNDSAPTHFAMAAGAPVLTIYCSTVPEFGFYGYSDKSHHLSSDVSCKPCGIHGHKKCPAGHFECGTKIKAYEVIRKVKEILDDRT